MNQETKSEDRKGLGLLAIGASAGGVRAIRLFLDALPSSFEIPVVIVQHLPRGPRLDFNLIYGLKTGRRLREVEDKLRPEPGDVVMAAPDYHMTLERDGTLSLSQDETVNYSRPSIDVFFESVALSYGSRAAAFLMSGANDDGALGLWSIHRAGGLTIVQDPNEAQNSTMPNAALALFRPDFTVSAADAADIMVRVKRGELSSGSKGRVFEDQGFDRR